MPSNNWGGDTKEEKGNCYAQIDLMIKGDLRHDVSHETHDQFYNIFFVLPDLDKFSKSAAEHVGFQDKGSKP